MVNVKIYTTLALAMLLGCTLLLVPPLSQHLVVAGGQVGCCSQVLSGLDLEEQTSRLPEGEWGTDGFSKFIKLGSLHDIISQVLRKMLLHGALTAIRPHQIERIVRRGKEETSGGSQSGTDQNRHFFVGDSPALAIRVRTSERRGPFERRIVKRGRETEGSWAPSGGSRSGTGQQVFKPFFAANLGNDIRVRTRMNGGELFERIFKRTGNDLQDEKKRSNQIFLPMVMLVRLHPRSNSNV